MKISEYLKSGDQEGKEKHVPFIKVGDCSTCGELNAIIKVGENIFHPSMKEHYIQYVELFGVTAEGKMELITRFDLVADAVPYVITHFKKGLYKSVLAVSMCNVHGGWENSLEL